MAARVTLAHGQELMCTILLYFTSDASTTMQQQQKLTTTKKANISVLKVVGS